MARSRLAPRVGVLCSAAAAPSEHMSREVASRLIRRSKSGGEEQAASCRASRKTIPVAGVRWRSGMRESQCTHRPRGNDQTHTHVVSVRRPFMLYRFITSQAPDHYAAVRGTDRRTEGAASQSLSQDISASTVESGKQHPLPLQGSPLFHCCCCCCRSRSRRKRDQTAECVALARSALVFSSPLPAPVQQHYLTD